MCVDIVDCVPIYKSVFCRSVITHSHQDSGQSTVCLVDYGTSERVNNSKLKVLPRELRQIPPIAIHCSIKQQSVLDMSETKFGDLIQGKELTVNITSVGDASPAPYLLHIPALDSNQGD